MEALLFRAGSSHVLHSVALIGVDTGSGRPVIDANGSSSAITLRANGTRIEGFNLTGSGGCGCGNAGIFIDSSDNIIQNNILYKNRYGVYIEEGATNNTIPVSYTHLADKETPLLFQG